MLIITYNAIVLFFIASNVLPYKICSFPDRMLKYSQVTLCHRSNTSVIFSAQVDGLQKCSELANHRRGFAFNFSPATGREYLPKLKKNCEILGCPEIGKANTLVNDLAFDYYSAFRNSNGKFK